MSRREKKPAVPSWLVALAVLGTVIVTAWAVWETDLQGPHASWDMAQDTVEGVWPGAHPLAQSGPFAPGAPAGAARMGSSVALAQGGAPAAPGASPVTPTAAMPGAPPILAGSVMAHGDRGPCTGCHTVLTGAGMMVPPIGSTATMPHGFRGVCSNCHRLQTGAGRNVAAALPGSAVPLGPLAPSAAARAPVEAEWKGLEVTQGARGVTVNGAEGDARRAGLQPGDVLSSINAMPVRTLSEFATATRNGSLAQGTLIVRRGGQPFAFELTGPASAGRPGQPMPTPPSQVNL